MLVSSHLVNITCPTVDVKRHLTDSCDCRWFDIKTDGGVNLQLAFEKQADLIAFVHLMMIAAGIKS